MKNWLRSLIFVPLIAAATMANAAFPEGEWTVKLWSDTGAPVIPWSSYKICIKSGGTFYAQANPVWSGKWFIKGNDVHLISVHSSGSYGFSFEVSKVNSNTLSGYYQWIGYSSPGVPSASEFDTTILSFNRALCTF